MCNLAEERWRRPDSVPFPSVWRRCTGKKTLPDGSVLKFIIQDVSEELEDAVIEHMNYFLKDEVMNAYTKMYEDTESLSEIHRLWKEFLKQRVSVVALVEGQPTPTIAGANLLAVNFKGDDDDLSQYHGAAVKKVFAALDYVSHQVDVYEKYGVNEYLTAMGLSVDPKYRGQGLGLELLKARYDIGKAVGLKLTATVFTGIESQIQAERAGFELVAEVPYDEYKVNGQRVFNIPKVKSLKYMAARIQ